MILSIESGYYKYMQITRMRKIMFGMWLSRLSPVQNCIIDCEIKPESVPSRRQILQEPSDVQVKAPNPSQTAEMSMY